VKVTGVCTALLDVFIYMEDIPYVSSGNSMIYNRSSSWFFGVNFFVLRYCSLHIILQIDPNMPNSVIIQLVFSMRLICIFWLTFGYVSAFSVVFDVLA
jgi:hypothetical protein